MIELSVAPNGFDVELVDTGEVVRGIGGAGQRQNRLGGHYRASFTFPPLRGEVNGRTLKSQLTAGQSQGVKIELPLPMSQGLPGTPVVDGGGQSGKTLAVRGLTPYYAGRVGWWLNIIAADGTICLHDISAPFVADASGDSTISIEPALRLPFADGDAIELAHPVIAGFAEGVNWNVSLPHLYGFEVTIEEAV